MSRHLDEPPEDGSDDEPFARPFLSGYPVAGPAPLSDPSLEQVRPYLLTGGRTRPRGALVTMETVVQAIGPAPLSASGPAGVERARILRLAARPCSAAEVSARLNLPLAVALVLVTDLVADGLLDASMVTPRQAEDIFFLERLIAGVAAL